MDRFYSKNEIQRYYNKFIVISEPKKIATPIISKNACSSLFKIALVRAGYECYCDKYGNIIKWWGKRDSLLIKEEDLPNYKKVAVVRNPLDRICSAYNTIGNNMPREDYVNEVICALSNYDANDINRHIASQFAQYDTNLIDEFIPIEYLDEYLHLIDIGAERINVSRYPFKIDNERLDELLEGDFKMYNEILNGDKCYKH